MRGILFAAAIAAVTLNTALADEWIVEAHYQDHAALARAAALFGHVIVDDSRGVLRVSTDDNGMRALTDAGLQVDIDEAATAKLRANTQRVAAARARIAAGGAPLLNSGGYATIPGYQCFRSIAGTYATMDDLAADHPGIVAIDDIGPTWEKTQNAADGFEMEALRITNFSTIGADPERPKMVVFSSIHAREYSPAEVDTRFAEYLVNGYGSDPEATWLVDHNDFHLVLLANPDARVLAEQQIYQRKNMDTINGPCGDENESSQPGIDLNRNFPFHWNITHGEGSSNNTCSETYRGPSVIGNPNVQGTPEPETQNLMQYVAGTCDSDGVCSGGLFADRRDGPMDPPSVGDDGGAPAPVDTTGFFVDIHSNAALVLWPWGDTSSAAPNQAALRTLGRRIAYFNGYTPEQSDQLYPTDGTTDDSMYGLLGVPGFTIETNGSDFFEDCGTFESDTAPRNIAALRYAARTLHAPYELPAGPDTIDVAAGSDLIATGDPITITAHLDSSRFNQSNGSEPVHPIASAAAFVDQLPWDAGAIPQPLDAADGAFDSPVEDATGSLPGNAVALGQHLIYVQGVDDADQAGTPNAALINVVDPATVGTLSGRISDQATTAPLIATIALSNSQNGETHQAVSDGTTGDYRAHGYPGVFNVHVSAPHHLSEDLADVDLVAGGSIAHDFALLPNCTMFSDDVESGNSMWTAQSPWVIANNVPGNTTHVWSTPNYGDDINSSLTSTTPVDLTGYSDIAVDFDDRCDTENGYDFGYLEYSADGGSSWNVAWSCTGQTTWQSHHVDLPADANGASAFKLRFRLNSDEYQNAPGWAIDNIRLEAGGDACRAQPNDTIFDDGFDG